MHHNIYKTLRNIGGGNFGRVDLVQNQTDHKNYVIKVPIHLSQKLKVTQTNKTTILKQVQIMRSLCHQYVIRYYQSFQDNDNNVCIVMQYAQHGQLQKYLNKRKIENNPLTQDEVLEWFIQLCLGIKYIHDQRILHRDLKCENIFISGNNQMKIGDFGISKNMKATFDMAQTKIGTPCVMAPQIWENKGYNQKSDIWSLGCILYKMMTFNHAFQSKSNIYFNIATAAYVLKITSGNYQPIHGNYSNDLKNLVKMMLSLDAHSRPSVHSILQMDFIKNKVSEVLQRSLRKYQQSIQSPSLLLQKQKSSQSNHRLLSQKRSFSSLSNSSMLTPKNSTTFDNTKIVQLKQSYPVLVQQVKKLKQKVQEDIKKKQIFGEQSKKLILDIMGSLGKAGKNGEVQKILDKLSYKIQELIES